jgi:hypothetical protein
MPVEDSLKTSKAGFLESGFGGFLLKKRSYPDGNRFYSKGLYCYCPDINSLIIKPLQKKIYQFTF